MSILNIFKKLKPNQPQLQTQFDGMLSGEKMLRIVLDGQAQTILDIIKNPTDFNGITSKKLFEYWLNYEFVCYSNDGFKIIEDSVEYPEYRFTPEKLANFTLEMLKTSEADIVYISTALSSALDAACIKYAELTDLCNYLQENNLRVRKA